MRVVCEFLSGLVFEYISKMFESSRWLCFVFLTRNSGLLRVIFWLVVRCIGRCVVVVEYIRFVQVRL